MVIDDADVDKATELAATLLALFEKPFIWSGREFFMSSSIGISVYPEDGHNIQQLLATADTAMYRVKQDGRNAFHFYHEAMNTDLQRKLDLDGRLRQALGKGELVIFYQPIIDLQTHNIVAAEALLRWQDKKYGSVSPDEFIPLAEQNGFIHKLGDFVIKQACQQAAQWQSIQPLQIAVNFSSVQFRYCEQICHQIERALAISGLPADKLEIEVTESLLFDHSKAVVALLEKLQALGTQLTIDDFGTGYSALSYLQKFPFHRLKIDKSFLQNLDTNAANRELVNAIVAMAQALKLTVVAEGIESQWQAEHLQKMGCDFGQGYYFSRPVPAEEFEQLLLTMNTAEPASVIDQA
ncbi:diguanylate cyclase [Photobacterium aphoticum]|uniref:cyclic-guanylate-specific phosphodiesterase n=1 Tax=Photobacterium aphoticum TaxID=754436 RepID=A0A090QLB1_9GAMM|nr:diguanylate cyclase [Photobacterium aphoticum]